MNYLLASDMDEAGVRLEDVLNGAAFLNVLEALADILDHHLESERGMLH